MKAMRFLLIFLCYGLIASCDSKENSVQNQSTEMPQEFTIGDKNYSFSDIEEIVYSFEQGKNLSDIEVYRKVKIPDTTGGLINSGLAKTRIEEFKKLSSALYQPHAFSYRLKTIKKFIAEIESLNN